VTEHPDIFGGDTRIMTRALSAYQDFKQRNRYRLHEVEGQLCGSCEHFTRVFGNTKMYSKCELLGISNSEATDIRKRDVCDLWLIAEEYGE